MTGRRKLQRQARYVISGILYCVAPLAELNGNGDVRTVRSAFHGIARLETAAVMRALAAVSPSCIGASRAVVAQEYSVADLAAAFGRGVVVIEANLHACYSFDVFVAESDTQKMRGLMFVRELPQQNGMLFIYRDTAVHSMWMKNTYIPLDILFIRGDGTVSSVARNTEPLSLRSISATEPVNYVLELNAGVTQRLAIDAGSTMILQ